MRKVNLGMITAALLLAGCVSHYGESATVSYDAAGTPYAEVQRQAVMQCQRFNMRPVLRQSAQVGPTPTSRRDDFDCVEK